MSTTLNAGQWYPLTGTAISGAVPLDSIQLMVLSSSSWSGNVYFDNIQFR